MDRTATSCVEDSSDEGYPYCAADAGGGAVEAGTGTGTGSDIDDTAGYQPLWVRLACIALDFLTQTYDQIRIVPEIVLFERWICEPYLPDGTGYSHDVCRSPDIQYQLAQLRSGRAFFDGVASMKLPMNMMQLFKHFICWNPWWRGEGLIIIHL